jgi:hypothetical protein
MFYLGGTRVSQRNLATSAISATQFGQLSNAVLCSCATESSILNLYNSFTPAHADKKVSFIQNLKLREAVLRRRSMNLKE